MTISKNNKMMAHLNYRMKITLLDGRTFVGYFKAFDKHMNIIVADCEEFRRIKPKPGKKASEGEEKRTLGLVLLRGEHIISLTVDGPPARDDDAAGGIRMPKVGGAPAGPGQARPAGRGIPPQMGGGGVGGIPPPGMGGQVAPGLAGAARGVGGPGMAAMAPGGQRPF